MKFLVFLLCNIIFINQLISQSVGDPYLYAVKEFKEKGYLASIVKLEKAKSDYFNTPYDNYYCQIVSTYYSFIGEYKKALAWADSSYRTYMNLKDTTSILADYPELKSQDAITYILSKVDHRQIVMINEAHHVPMHRAFTTTLLDSLYKKGFRYLALEALWDNININEKKYPVFDNTGVYINEPVFGELVRHALQLGYTLVDYENRKEDCKNDTLNKEFCFNYREIQEALNLKKILDKDPNAKIIVHAGYGHIEEKGEEGRWIRMAELLKLMTNIDPLTIEQTIWTEKSVPIRENPFYRYASKKYSFIQKAIIFTTNDNPYIDKNKIGLYDLQVFHPRTTYIYSRPSWMKINNKKYYIISSKSIKKNNYHFIQAFYDLEKNGIPADQILIDNKITDYALVLPKGKFTLKFYNTKNEVIKTQKITVD